MPRPGSGSIAPPMGKCRLCGTPLVRDETAKRPRWLCTNAHCTMRLKPGFFVGGVRIVGKDEK